MRVIVIGAGIGGLTLAQGLQREGIDVAVYDRDASPSDTGGYRLHLGDQACAALERRMPPALYQAVLASAAGGSTFRRFAFCDHRLRVLSSERQDFGDRLMIGRIPLRELLAHGLDDAVRFGVEYTGHRTGADGRVTVELSDGSTDTGDVLVAADGARSRVVRTLTGRPPSAPTGITGIAGRTPLDDDARDLLPSVLRAGPALAIGPGGIGTFLTVHDPATAVVDPATCVDVPARLERPYLLWAPGLPTRHYPRPPTDLDGRELVALGLELFRGWPASLRELVRRADPDSVGCFEDRKSVV